LVMTRADIDEMMRLIHLALDLTNRDLKARGLV
jgi:putrescine aminotransferase